MLGVGFVVIDALDGGIEGREADYNDVDVRLAAGLAFPGERAVGKVNLDPVAAEEQSPDDAALARLG